MLRRRTSGLSHELFISAKGGGRPANVNEFNKILMIYWRKYLLFIRPHTKYINVPLIGQSPHSSGARRLQRRRA